MSLYVRYTPQVISGGGGGSGTVTNVSILTANGFSGTVSNPTTTPALTLSTTVTGILQGNGTSISAATTGNLTDSTSGSDGITITNGSGAILGSGTSIAQAAATSSQNGYLTSTDWNTFNNKQAAGNYITALTGDGTASGPGSAALTLSTVNSNVGSYTNAAITVNAKGLVTAASSGTVGNFTDSTSGADGITVTGGTGAVLGSGTSIAQAAATASQNGYLKSTDWTTFNNKQSAGNYLTSVSVTSANGFAGTSSGGLTPSLTLSTTINSPVLSGNGTAIAAATTTGTGSTVVLSSGPTLSAPVLGTPASGNLSNCTNLSLSTGVSGTLGITNGGTGVTSVTTTPTALAFAGWDSNKNLSANNQIEGYTTTVTSGTTVVLTVGSTYFQYFTGSTNQTVTLPVVTTLVNGFSFQIINNSTANVTVQTSGSNTLQVVAPSYSLTVTCINTAGGTGTASWSALYTPLTAGAASPLTTKGDIYTYSTTNARQPVPGDYGELIADSTQTTGWRSAPYTSIQRGRPGKNYIQYPDFENNSTTGWSLGTVGTLTNGLPTGTPTFGSGAASSLTISTTSSSIEGSYSLQYADSNSSGTTAGNMVATSSYAIDSEDQGKVLTVKFYYKTTTGSPNFSGTSSNSFAWAVYDVTNSSWLTSAGNFNLVQSSGCGYVTGTVQTNSTTANIRFVIYNANATSSATTLVFDGFYVGPQTAPIGPALTDWVAYTPTTNWTNTTCTGQWRRVGGSVEVYVQATLTGTPSGSSITVSIPSGLSVDTTKISTTVDSSVFGSSGSILVPGTAVYLTQVQLASTTTVGGVYISNGSTSATSGITPSAPISQVSGNILTFNFSVPITGWSSNSSMSADTDTRVIASQYSTLSSTTYTNGTALNFTTSVYDLSGSLSSGAFVAPVSGFYKVGYGGSLTTSATTNLSVYVNGSSRVSNISTLNSSTRISFATEVKLNAGDSVTIVPQGSGTFSDTNGYFSIERLSGPSVVTATESVNANYNTSSTSISTTNSVIVFSNKNFDSHNAYSTSSGLYTAPVSGKYRVSTNIRASSVTSGNLLDAYLYKNGSQYSTLGEARSSSTGALACGGSDTVSCLAGDTIAVYAYCGNSTSLTGTSYDNHIAIERIGN